MKKKSWELLNINCVSQKSTSDSKVKAFFNSYDKENKVLTFDYNENLTSPFISALLNLKNPIFSNKDLNEIKKIELNEKTNKLTASKNLLISFKNDSTRISKTDLSNYLSKSWLLKRKKYFFKIAKQLNFRTWKRGLFKRLQSELFTNHLENKILYFGPYYNKNTILFLNLLKKYENIYLNNFSIEENKFKIFFLLNWFNNYRFYERQKNDFYSTSFYLTNPKRNFFVSSKNTLLISKNLSKFFNKKEEQKNIQEYLFLKNTNYFYKINLLQQKIKNK